MHNQNTPKVSRFGFSVFVILLAGLAPISAHAVDTNYNMNRFLIQTHPFANTAPIPFEQPVPQKAPHAPLQKSPQTQAAGAQSPSKMAAHASAEQSDLTPGSYKWISEVRGGIMKHSVASLVGNRSKETGIDGNLEVLFVSPDLFKYIWSPRPHIGASVNTSSNNTDYGYAGLTWEWNPWKTVFFDFSFGFAGHNGKHADDANVPFPSDVNRKRELGCTMLFRESFELGFVVAKHHGISVVWDHLSNGGLCSQNEGLDNAGIRYGYRF